MIEKEIFVTRQECNASMDAANVKMEEVNGKLAVYSTKLAVIESKVNLVLWILGTIGGGILAMLVKMFFEG